MCFGSFSKETKEWRGLLVVGWGGEKENEVDFRLEKCSGEFYNFLANFLLIPVSTLQYYKIFAKIKIVNFKIESKLHPSQQFENNQYVIL